MAVSRPYLSTFGYHVCSSDSLVALAICHCRPHHASLADRPSPGRNQTDRTDNARQIQNVPDKRRPSRTRGERHRGRASARGSGTRAGSARCQGPERLRKRKNPHAARHGGGTPTSTNLGAHRRALEDYLFGDVSPSLMRCKASRSPPCHSLPATAPYIWHILFSAHWTFFRKDCK